VPSSVAPELRQVIERGWALDPKERPTMAVICETLAGASWRVFPGADTKKVADAELELPTSPATVALLIGKLEGENTILKSEIATLKSEVAQIPALKADNTKPKAESGRLKAEIERLKAVPAPAKPTVVAPVPSQQAIAPGTLLVVGNPPPVVVELAGGVCCGFAAVVFEGFGFIADLTSTSFVFSLRPTAARYPLKDTVQALLLG
jgi:hypothetical protein